MNNRKKGDRFLIDNPYVGPVTSSDSGTEMIASCFITKNNKPLAEHDVAIRINDGGIEKIVTDEYGFVSKKFITKDDVVKATFIIIKDDDSGEILKKESRPYSVREKKDTDKVGSSFYYDIEPAVTAKVISAIKIVDDFTADTDEAWKYFSDWIETKTAYEKKWMFQTISKVKPDDMGRFMEQFIYYREKVNGKDNPNRHKDLDELARNFGLLPVIDIFTVFNNYMNKLQQDDSESYSTIESVILKFIGEKANNFQFHCAHMKEDDFISTMKSIAKSSSPEKTILSRGFCNKPKIK